MKAKNFKNGAVVQIKAEAMDVCVPLAAVGTVGILDRVEPRSDGELTGLAGQVGGWFVRPEHVSLITRAPETKPVPQLTPGFYTDGDGDLWIVAPERQGSDTLRVVNLISLVDIDFGRIQLTDLMEGDTLENFAQRSESWLPLRKVADLPHA